MQKVRVVGSLLLVALSACVHQHAAEPPVAPAPPAAAAPVAAPEAAAAPETAPVPMAPTAQTSSAPSAPRPATSTPVPAPRAAAPAPTKKPPPAAAAPAAASHAGTPEAASTTAPATISAPATVSPPAPEPSAAAAAQSLDLAALEQRLRDTRAIGVFTKLSIKNQVDDLLAAFKGFHGGRPKPTLADLRQKYELLLFKVVSVLQDKDGQLASAVSSSREAIWGVLADPHKFSQISAS